MVKIRELTNPQLLQQIVKYQNILDQLFTERSARLEQGTAKQQDVLTPEELKKHQPVTKPAAAKKEESPPAEQAQAEQAGGEHFQVAFDDDEITEMEQRAEEAKSTHDDETGEIRVTQLLTLNKDQLAELQENAKKIKKEK